MLRVVIYAEGAGELTGRDMSGPRATVLTDQQLGAAHLLVRRCLIHTRNLASEDIQFEEPLRSPRGQLARGSMLHSKATLRPLLFWADEKRRPDLAIVLVDADGKEKARRDELSLAFRDILLTAVAAVAVQEFEAWLIADPQALKKLFSQSLSPSKPPEQLTRQQAKELLQQWCETRSSKHEPAELRRQLAEECDLETVSSVCPSFARFLEDLKTARG